MLPWLAHAALFLDPAHSPDRRARAAWRTALWLAVLTAFVPSAWPLAVVLAVLAVAAAGPDRAALGRLLLVPLLGTLVLLLPWTVSTWAHHGLGSLLEAGLPVPRLDVPLSRWDVLLGRPGEGAPGWLSVGLLVAALAALVRTDTRPVVLRCWAVVVVALAGTALVTGLADRPQWLGFLLVVAQAAAVTAAAVAGAGIRGRLSGASFTWRQPAGGLVVLLAVLTPVLGALWWVATGSGGPLDRGPASPVPTYMTDAATADPASGVLLVRGSRERGFTYVLLRGPGLRLGDDTVVPSAADQASLTRVVAGLATAPDPGDVRALGRQGIGFVYAPAPVDAALVGNLDSVSGLSPGSALSPGSRAWQLEGRRTPAPAPAGDPLRPWLLLLQGVAVVVALVLAAPTRRSRR